MTQETYVDGVLRVWGERWDWSPLNRKPQLAKQTSTGVLKPGKASSRPPMSAQIARRNLKAFVRKQPQVVVKISGGGKGLKKVMAHIRYISRKGELILEDQDGEQIKGAEGRKELRQIWAHGSFPIPDDSEVREAINVVLSMPEGTDELAVARAARDFARREFGENYQYVMAVHTFADDPGPEPSKHPHVHLAIKSRGFDGTRLNPRKADLQDWREGFAQALREHGVDAIATRRRTRLQRAKGEKQALKRIKSRGQTPRTSLTARSQPKAIKRAADNASAVLQDYQTIAEALAQSDAEDRKLAIELVRTLQGVNRQIKAEGRAERPRATTVPPDKER